MTKQTLKCTDVTAEAAGGGLKVRYTFDPEKWGPGEEHITLGNVSACIGEVAKALREAGVEDRPVWAALKQALVHCDWTERLQAYASGGETLTLKCPEGGVYEVCVKGLAPGEDLLNALAADAFAAWEARSAANPS